ncbi:MAG: hypothetical protein R3F19_25130 [Verrucomicrobiales bacterium]
MKSQQSSKPIERIIGRRQVPSKEKILSLYDADINVIVRGKLGAFTKWATCLPWVNRATA